MLARALLIVLTSLLAGCAGAARTPNVIIFFADDMGYGDLGCYGSSVNMTPNIDRLAREGVRLTNFYAAQPVCSASRAALLTGCYPNRVGIAGALGPRAKVGLNPEETTLAEIAKARGYATAIFGKWHLGDAPNLLPSKHGFDEWFGFAYSNDMWPRHPQQPKNYPPLQLLEERGGELHVLDDDVYPADQCGVTKEITRRATEFVRAHAEAPFFLYVPYPMPHVPLYVSPEFDGKTGKGRYADVLAEIDWSVGEVMSTLDSLSLAKDTIIVFASDNGPWLSYGDHAGTTGGLREGKGTTWEGGVRVPCIVRAPSRVERGATFERPVMAIDLLPTLAAMIGGVPPHNTIDGVDLSPWLAGREESRDPHDALYFYYNSNELQAVRSGEWKLYLPHKYNTLGTGHGGTGGAPANYASVACGLELYNLASDPQEKTDVAAANADVVARLTGFAERARADLGDSLTKRKGSGGREAGRAQWPAEAK